MRDVGSNAALPGPPKVPLVDLPVVDLPFAPRQGAPAGRPRGEVAGDGGGTMIVSERLEPALAIAVGSLASTMGATTSDVVLAGFCAALHRYQRNDDLVVGLDNGVGITPVVISGRGKPTAAEWTGRSIRALDAAASGATSNDPDVAVTDTQASPQGPLTRCLLRRSGPDDAAAANNTNNTGDTGGGPQAEAEVVLSVDERAGAIDLVMELRAPSIHPTAPRFLGQVALLLRQFVDRPDEPMASLRLLADDESALLASWNDTDRRYEPGQTLVSMFSRQVARTPDAPAVSGPGDQCLSYRQLDERVAHLAGWLASVGVGPESHVGLLVDRSPEMIVALYAILRAGAAYVPLDPEYPAERLVFMADEAELGLILTQDHLRALVPPGSRRVLSLDTEWSEVEQAAPLTPRAIDEDAAAYVLYTSGSTGRPKGVVNTHRGIVNRLCWMQEHLGLTADDCVLQKTPFSFDVSVWELFWPLQVGARLVMAEPGGHRDPAYLQQVMADESVTTVHFVPSMLRLFLDFSSGPDEARGPDDDARNPGDDAASLVRVVCSGEALTAELVERFFAVLGPDVELHNLYGPTEAAVDVTAWRCRPADRSDVVPIGRPIANTQIHILDPGLQPVPIGVAGELCIGGVQVARGYLRRPELTAERFVPDPFSDGGRLYRTGDLARWSEEGQLEFLGRTDHQVKIRGNRVEPGEIDATLLRHRKISGAATTVHHRPAGLRLAAHYTVVDGEAVSPSDLRAFLGTTLPTFLIPNLFIEHPALPLTPSGKVDRHALDTAFDQRARPPADRVAPGDELEQFLADLWAEVLGLDGVGITDRFFELGGDSIQAAQLVNRIQQELGAFIYVVTLFTAPTIAQYAQMLRRDYAPAVAARFGSPPAAPAPDRAPGAELGGPGPGSRSLPTTVAALRDAVPRFDPGPSWDRGPTNQRAVFVLSPPRSGTSLLRVMLAGHPGLFAASELQLLPFGSLRQRRAAFSPPFQLWGEGTIRALMAVDGLDAVAATTAMEAHEADDRSAKDFYRYLQDRVAPRLLVDKSPSYALDRAALDNAEAGFDSPFYVHLVRHPHEMVNSFVDYHMDQVLFLDQHDLSPAELAEAVWVESHRTTLDFLAGIAPERWCRLRFEDLVLEPEATMAALITTIGLPFVDDLVDPYRNLSDKMVDGLHQQSTPMGDTRLLDHGAINPDVVDRWRREKPGDILHDETWVLAQRLGYQRGPGPAAPEPATVSSRPRPDAGRRRQQVAARQRRRRQGRS